MARQRARGIFRPVLGLRKLRSFGGRLWRAQCWRPTHAELCWHQVVHRNRNRDRGYTDRDHLLAASHWLRAAQDATGNGGVSGRYRLAGGWSPAYPETTGYLVPTFLRMAEALGDTDWRFRAEHAVRFLLGAQLDSGAFSGGEVGDPNPTASVFNTAQILCGLTAWHRATGDSTTLAAAHRAASWLVQVQEPDGAWRRHVYWGVPSAYSAHASCWLAEFGAHTDRPEYLRAAENHLDWVLQQRDAETGWIHLMGFGADDHRAGRAVTHTIGYTLWGLLRTAELTGRNAVIQDVNQAAQGIARRLELSGRIPGVLDQGWRSGASYTCLTGNAQLALVWLRLYGHVGDARLVSAALKAIDLVKRAQVMTSSNPGLRGGIPGSAPIWGDYIPYALPNWAPKFFIDALLDKQEMLQRLPDPPRARWVLPADVPTVLPPRPVGHTARPVRIVMLSSVGSDRVPRMLSAWEALALRPVAVVLQSDGSLPLWKRAVELVREDGARVLLRRMLHGSRGRVERPTPRAHLAPVATFCRARGIPVIFVRRHDSPEAAEHLTALAPDVVVQAGAGILRAPVLRVPRLGTLNAHMGLLPRYRGMSVPEWARLNGDAAGVTVHVTDAGIDTGPILCATVCDPLLGEGTSALRDRLDREQIALLGSVLQYVVASGELPPARVQSLAEGVQFFRMHPELILALDRNLVGLGS